MRSRVYKALEALFKISLCACLALGTLLVLGQLAGVVTLQPDWITESRRLFLRPTIVCAVTFGLVAFVASYFRPAEQGRVIESA